MAEATSSSLVGSTPNSLCLRANTAFPISGLTIVMSRITYRPEPALGSVGVNSVGSTPSACASLRIVGGCVLCLRPASMNHMVLWLTPDSSWSSRKDDALASLKCVYNVERLLRTL